MGERIGQLRRDGNLTQEELAERTGLSLSAIQSAEQGKRQPRLATLHAIARVLGVSTSALFEPVSEVSPPGEHNANEARLLALRQVIAPASLGRFTPDAPDAGEPMTLAGLLAAVRTEAVRYDSDDFLAMTDTTPVLIREARAAAELLVGDERREALRVLSQACQLAASVLSHLRKEDLAYLALCSGRQAAEAADDALMLASVECVLSRRVLTRQGRFAEAADVAARAADAIAPNFASASPEALGVWGRLMTAVAAAASRDNQHDEARSALRAAAAAGAALGGDVYEPGQFWASFGPAKASILAVESEVVADRPDAALRISRQRLGLRDDVRPRVFPKQVPNKTVTRHLLDVASAFATTGQAAHAARVLTQAKDAAPEWIKHQRMARDLVTDLRASDRNSRLPGLRQLAEHMRVPA